METKYFQSEKLQDEIKNSIYVLKNSNIHKAVVLSTPLEIIRSNSHEFDKSCQHNIEWIGAQFIEKLTILKDTDNENLEKTIDDLLSMVYRFILEFDLSRNFELSSGLRNFKDYCQYNIENFSINTKNDIEYAAKWMHISIIKRILNSEKIEKFLEYSEKYKEIENKINSWDSNLKTREDSIERHSNNLKNYENAFNFVGLYKGFDDLHRSKIKEHRWSQAFTTILGLSTLLPLSYRLYTQSDSEITNSNWVSYFANLIPYIAITFLILYFFKISYRVMDNIKSQILQIEIRKTLCQFIQNYTDFSSDASKKSPETLKKFESLIFSNIVSTSEKIPSTFDGIESITNLISLTKSTK